MIARRVGDIDVQDFENNLFTDTKVLDARVVVYSYPLKVITPFKNYRQADGWWKIYNSLKHNRIENYKKANLRNTLNALGSLFLLLMRYKDEEFTKALIRFGLLKTSFVIEFVHGERLSHPAQFWEDSELFGAPEMNDYLPEDLSTINPAFASSKFKIFFGRFNPQA